MKKGRHTGFNRSLAIKHGQQVAKVGVPPLLHHAYSEKPAFIERASSFFGAGMSALEGIAAHQKYDFGKCVSPDESTEACKHPCRRE